VFRKLIFLGLISVLGVGLSSCDSDNIERQRTVVEVSSVAENGVFLAGIWDAGSDKIFPSTDDFQPAGHIPITLKTRSYNGFVQAPDLTPYGQFVVTAISVDWRAAHPSTPVAQLSAFNYSAGYNLVVPKDTEVTFNLMVIPFTMKEDPFFRNLVSEPTRGGDGSTPSFNAVAHFTITGHDSGAPDLPRTLEGSVIVEFIGVLIEE
jgi:hypothetical protein